MNIQFIIIICLAGGVLAYTLQHWLPPASPLLFFMAGSFSIIGCFALLYQFIQANPDSDLASMSMIEDELGNKESLLSRGVAVPEIIATFFGLTFLGLWAFAPIRALMVYPASLQNEQGVIAALDDPSVLVQTKACTHLLTQKKAPLWSLLVEKMTLNPEMTQKCIDAVSTKDRERAEHIGKLVKDRWLNLMMVANNTSAVEHLCGSLKTMSWIGKFSRNSSAPQQLQCAIRAAVYPMRYCCAQEFKTHGTFNSLGTPSTFQSPYAASIQSTLARLTFNTKDLDSREQGIAKELQTSDRFNQRWLVGHGCVLLESDNVNERNAALRGFVQFSESATCTPKDVTIRRLVNKTETWRNICEHYDYAPIERKAEFEEVLCEGMILSASSRAIDKAQKIIHAATRSYLLEGLGKDVAESHHVAGYGSAGVHNPFSSSHRRQEVRSKVVRHNDGTMDVSRLNVSELMILMGAQPVDEHTLTGAVLSRSDLLKDADEEIDESKLKDAMSDALGRTNEQRKKETSTGDALEIRKKLVKEGVKGKKGDLTKLTDKEKLKKEQEGNEKLIDEKLGEISDGIKGKKKRK